MRLRMETVQTKRLFHFALLAVLVLGLAACERTEISRIAADPGRYFDKEVNVGGRVTESYGFLSYGMYQIDDGTGSLWVFADRRGVPSKGALVGVKGRITPTLTLMGRSFATVMRESDRRSGD